MDRTNLPKITVIVPVYNVERYLDRCVNSIVQQTYSNLEIILVNDGSTDSSGKKCEDWKSKDDRIIVIHKKNGGLGYARNSGIEKMTGDYVSFIDSDDYIKNDTYELLVDRLMNTKSEVCYFGCNYDNKGQIIIGTENFPQEVYCKAQIEELLLPISFGTSIEKEGDAFGIGSVCCGIYNSKLFTEQMLRFGSEREVLCEDILFTSKLLTKVKCVSFCNENFYYYFKNSTSLTHSYRKDRFEKTKKFYQLQLELINDNGLSEKCTKRAKYSFLINVIVCLKQELSRENASFRLSKEAIDEISKSDEFRTIYRSIDLDRLNTKKRILLFCLYHRMIRLVYACVRQNDK